MSAARDDRYEVTIVKYGTRATTRAEVFLNYPLYHEADAPIGMDYFFWIVRNQARTFVVDTGFSPQGGRSRGRTQLAPVPELLSRHGVDTGATPVVVLTHAHYDHAGNVGLFPASTILLSARELEFWMGGHAGRTLFAHSADAEAIQLIAKARTEGRVRLFDGRFDLAPGVEIFEVGGHTPGQCVVKVATDDGVVLLASDAVHYFEELERDMPFASVADVVGMYEAFERIRKLLASGEVDHLVPGHDPSTLTRFRPAATGGELAATIGGRGA